MIMCPTHKFKVQILGGIAKQQPTGQSQIFQAPVFSYKMIEKKMHLNFFSYLQLKQSCQRW